MTDARKPPYWALLESSATAVDPLNEAIARLILLRNTVEDYCDAMTCAQDDSLIVAPRTVVTETIDARDATTARLKSDARAASEALVPVRDQVLWLNEVLRHVSDDGRSWQRDWLWSEDEGPSQ